MILRLQLTQQQFACLAAFIASPDNQEDHLQQYFTKVEGSIYFEKKEKGAIGGFATILRASPTNSAEDAPHGSWWNQGGMDVTLELAECFQIRYLGESTYFFTPFDFLSTLMTEVDLFPACLVETGEDGDERAAAKSQERLAALQQKEFLSYEEQREVHRLETFLRHHRNRDKATTA